MILCYIYLFIFIYIIYIIVFYYLYYLFTILILLFILIIVLIISRDLSIFCICATMTLELHPHRHKNDMWQVSAWETRDIFISALYIYIFTYNFTLCFRTFFAPIRLMYPYKLRELQFYGIGDFDTLLSYVYVSPWRIFTYFLDEVEYIANELLCVRN